MDVRGLVRAGVMGGIVTVFLSLVGLIGRFVELNLVGAQVTFAWLMLVTVPVVLGYVVTRPRVEAGQLRMMAPRTALASGALAGAVAGATVGLVVLLATAIGIGRIRAVFLNVTEALVDFLTFGRPTAVAVLLLTLLFAAAGLAGATLRIAPSRYR
jgi:hypothetical protein